MIPTAKIPRMALACAIFCLAVLLIAPAHAFTADSLAIAVGTNGDAIADFHYTLEGVIENAIPLSVLQDQLIKGLATSSDPPQVISFNKSDARLLLKNFAVTNTVSNGTEYQTASMDFSKAQVALKNSAVSTVITADFTPKITTVTFPDGYSQQFTDQSTLPGIDHVIAGTSQAGSLQVNTSPEHARISVDGAYIGESPGLFSGISPGNHQILLEADGFVPLSRNVTVTAGQTAQLAVILSYATTPTPQSGAPGTGPVIVAIALAGSCVLLLHRKMA